MTASSTCVAVTGANGWLGTALVDRLLDDPSRTSLRLLVRTVAEQRELLRRLAGDRTAAPGVDPAGAAVTDRVTVVIGDVAKADSLRRLLHGCPADTTVVHVAGVIHPRRTREFFDVNTVGTRHAADAALDAGVRRFVHVSSNSPFGTNPDRGDVFRADEPFHPYLGYGRSKMGAELAVVEAVERRLPAVIVRPPWFYGPHQPARQTTFFRLVRTGRFPVIGDGEQRRSMVYIDNLVDGLLAAEQRGGSTGRGYWVADARPYTVNEIVETVGRALREEGYDVADRVSRLPTIASRIAERADRVIQRAGRYQQQLHVLGEMGHTIACDISRTESELGYRPAVELFEGMRRSIRWCRGRGIDL
jgi:nucleoside-diphosphate-sugar epimerase